MPMQNWLVPLTFILAATIVGGTHAASIPDLSGQWGRDMLFFEPPVSGLRPVARAERRDDGTFVPKEPCCGIVQSWFGDPNNSILRPSAADAVRRTSELAVQGT